MEKPLAENVYLLADTKPRKEDSDINGNVLYFSPAFGWHQGYWAKTYRDDVTHWTYLPEQPPAQESLQDRLNRTFNKWVDEKFPNVEVAARMLLRLGYEAGYHANR